jgi:chromosome segregation protein
MTHRSQMRSGTERLQWRLVTTGRAHQPNVDGGALNMDAGAHYYKTDLQVHTPRDRAWSGPRPTSDQQRAAYATDFVAACRLKGLRAVAITDHHDIAFFGYIRAAAEAERDALGNDVPAHERLVVFPGIELTLAVPCQALLILDADFPGQRLTAVLDVLAIDQTDPDLDQHDQPKQLQFQDLAELHQRLDANTWLRGHFAIFPNVTDGGHGTLMRKDMQAKYRDMPCVGGYVDGDADDIGTGNSEKFAGRDAAWGNKSIAVIQTSDSRTSTFETLGAHATWIKWARPTAEALRQACLAHESRIAHKEPGLPAVIITRLNVTNSKFMGPVDLELNPQYSALIGGRGTGKSTCLEYLRWALCDQPPEPSKDDDFAEQMGRRERLIAQTLAPYESQVEVHFLLNGIPHMVRRYAANGDVLLKVGSDELKPASPNDVRALLPIEAYSQRQLSSVGVRIAELTRFITRPIRERLDQIADSEAETAAESRQNFTQLVRHRDLTRTLARDRFAVESLAQQTTELRAALGGLSDDDRKLLADKPGYDRADQLVTTWRRRVEQLKTEISDAHAAVERVATETSAVVPEGLPERDLLVELQSELSTLMQGVRESVAAVEADMAGKTSDGSRLAALLGDWSKRSETFAEKYTAAAQRSTAHASKLDELGELETRQSQLQDSITSHGEELAALGNPSDTHASLREDWRRIQRDRAMALKEQCDELTQRSGRLIRATLQSAAETEALRDRIAAAISGSGVRAQKIESFANRISASEDPLVAWHEAMDELEMLLIDEPDDPASVSLHSALSTFTGQELRKMLEKMSPEAALELSLTQLDPTPRFEYRTKEQEYILFSDASAGQQATALLGLLLTYGGPPLIIDQPEDDLDSQAILGVVEQMWNAKHRRQIIFSSHNANLVVNGDAELVVVCDYRAAGDHSAGRIKLQGAIDIPEMREEITVVMEGGEKAFRLRKEKYGF